MVNMLRPNIEFLSCVSIKAFNDRFAFTECSGYRKPNIHPYSLLILSYFLTFY